MKVGYVVLYVDDAEACRRFWVEQVGMVEKRRADAGGFVIAQVGFADQDFAFELVPLGLMEDNPDGLDLATPSIALRVDDLEATHATLVGRGVQTTFYPAITTLSLYRAAGREHPCPRAEDFAARHLAMPLSTSMGPGEVELACDELAAAL